MANPLNRPSFLIKILCLSLNINAIQCIIGGKIANFNEWSYMVALVYDKNLICGGTLIQPNWVLTAARCVDKSSIGDINLIGVRAGVDDIHSSRGRIIEIIDKITHTKFNVDLISGVVTNDLALLRLAQKLVIAASLKTVKLASSTLKLGTDCQTAGWGIDKIDAYDGPDTSKDLYPNPHILKSIKQTPIDLIYCQNGLESFSRSQAVLMTNLHICTCVFPSDLITKTHGPSFGDTGGPLMCNGEQYGVASFSIFPRNDSSSSHMMGWTALSEYLEWIEDVVQKMYIKLDNYKVEGKTFSNDIESDIDEDIFFPPMEEKGRRSIVERSKLDLNLDSDGAVLPFVPYLVYYLINVYGVLCM